MIIGEFGIGTNRGARICPNMLEAEKAFGTVHFAIGDSYGLGKNASKHHYDALVDKVTIRVNGREIARKRPVPDLSGAAMTSRERLARALSHKEPDRVPVDFGGTAVTGIHVNIVAALRDHYGLEKRPVKVHEPYQMLGLVEEDLKRALGLDVEGVYAAETMFGNRNEDWKPWRLDNGLEVLVSAEMETTRDANGDTLVFPKGDRSAPPSARMPKDGFFFDTIIRQDPIDEAKLDPADNLEEFGPISDARPRLFRRATRAAAATGRGRHRHVRRARLRRHRPRPGAVPEASPGDPGHRGVVHLDPDPAGLCPRRLREADRDRPGQPGQDPRARRRPRPGRLRLRHGLRDPDLDLLLGRDVPLALCPLLPSASTTGSTPTRPGRPSSIPAGPSDPSSRRSSTPDSTSSTRSSAPRPGWTRRSSRPNSGRTSSSGAAAWTPRRRSCSARPAEVRDEVLSRLEIFGQGGGFVFNAVHNIQGNVPVTNVVAMFEAIREFHE